VGDGIGRGGADPEAVARRAVTAVPPVTIGLPVFNGERFLPKAMESILGQTFADFTLVVSDNASTDSTVEIIEEHAARDRRVVLIRNETNRGAAWNYNRVFAECRSPYFKWAAADDMLAATCVERSLAALEGAPPTVVLAYPQTQLIDAEGRLLRTLDEDLAATPGAPPRARFLRVVRNRVYGNVVFAVLRADALRKTRLHGSFPSADYVLLAELALVGEFRALPEPLFLRRLHDATSVRANPTAASLARWFDPQRPPVRSLSLNLFREHIRAIRHAELARTERIPLYVMYAAVWARRQVRPRSRVERAWGRVRAAVGASYRLRRGNPSDPA
jgi:glycosyltransferase involved in cell wall biosynthesis